MNTKTKPELKEPKHPGNVTLDMENSTRVDICVMNLVRSGLGRESVFLYIRPPSLDIDSFLEGGEGLETRFFPQNPAQVRDLVTRAISTDRPLANEERTPGQYYILEYSLSARDRVYQQFRELPSLE